MLLSLWRSGRGFVPQRKLSRLALRYGNLHLRGMWRGPFDRRQYSIVLSVRPRLSAGCHSGGGRLFQLRSSR